MDPDVLGVIRDTIKETVNGKIDHLKEDIIEVKQIIADHNQKHEKDMADIKPIIEAYQGFNTAGNLVKWVAGVGTAVGVLWMITKSLIKQ